MTRQLSRLMIMKTAFDWHISEPYAPKASPETGFSYSVMFLLLSCSHFFDAPKNRKRVECGLNPFSKSDFLPVIEGG